MLDWLKRLIACAPSPTIQSSDSPSAPDSPSEVRALQLDIAERERRITTLESEIQRHKDTQKSLIAESVNTKLDHLFSEVAAPISQLLTQIHLLDDKGKTVDVKDTLRLVKRLVRQLEESGLQVDSDAGTQVAFDANRHEPLSGDAQISNGDQADVLVPGLSFGGRVIRKAGVAAAKV